MNNRFFLALVLTAIVIVVTPLLFPSSVTRTSVSTDTTIRRAATSLPRSTSDSSLQKALIHSSKTISTISGSVVETTTVHTPYAKYALTTRGAVPIGILLDSFPSHRKDATGQSVQLIATHRALTSYQIVMGRDTIAFDTIPQRVEHISARTTQTTRYISNVNGHAVQLSYEFSPDQRDRYLFHVIAHIADALPGTLLLVSLPQTILPNESDTLDDLNHLAVSYRPTRGTVQSIAFSKLDTIEMHVDTVPINWVATRNKYFLVVFRADETPFSALRFHGGRRSGKIAAEVRGKLSLPIAADGSVAFDIYAGPQDFERLQGLGGDLDQVNPYAGFLHGVVQPFATLVVKALLWMKRTTQLSYGWVLVLFGITIRLILWPLNQGAMRTSMKMQRLQPELQVLQKKYSDDPAKQQEMIMKVYRDHGMSPLSPLMGCLPMLLPMPVLFALYNVFQNTIEFRGVPFLWLTDISLRDPYYITPLLMGISMFVMSWIGMRNSPPNPQAKMMSYMMPVMLTVLFLNFASGLNIYYAVQNVAAIPQQWLLARERGRQSTVISGLEKKRT